MRRRATKDAPPPGAGVSPAQRAEPEATSESVSTRCSPVGVEELRAALFSTGRPLVVNHWATWCDGCVEELPLLIGLHSRLAEGIDFVGVSWDAFQGHGDTESLCRWVEKFANQEGLQWDSLLVKDDPESLFAGLEMECRTVPQVWLVNAEGAVVHRVEQVLDDEMLAELERAAEAL